MNAQKIPVTLKHLEHAILSEILPLAKPGTIFLLSGQLGAGKTTLVKTLMKHLGIFDEVSSPTFGYINSYGQGSLIINHFDLYRLNSLDEFLMQGFDELLYKNNSIAIIEWPELLYSFLKEDIFSNKRVFCLNLEHDFSNPNIRYLSITNLDLFTKTK